MKMDVIMRLIVFCILMENGEGILVKSPEYVKEKFRSVMNGPYPEHFLDLDNIEKYGKYLQNWREHIRRPLSGKVKVNA